MFEKVEIFRKDTDCLVAYAFIPEHIAMDVLQEFASQYSEHEFICLFSPKNEKPTLENAMKNLVVYSSISERPFFKNFL